MKNLLIIGNWKLNGTRNTIIKLITSLINKLINISESNIMIAIAPPTVYLDTARSYLSHSNIKLCAQNVDTHLSGAFTGDISAHMLQDLNVQYVLIGHSERRKYHKENDIHIAEKFFILKKVGITPVLCIGENEEEYRNGHSKKICLKKIDTIIKLFGAQIFTNSVIAYEPIWAIGSGIHANPEHVQSIHQSIRNYIAKYDTSISRKILIQYGGSVNPENAVYFLQQQDIDGLLIGSASLNIEKFCKIITIAKNYKKISFNY